MKAVFARTSGKPDVLEIRNMEMPEPKDHEIRVKVAAGSITRGDVILRSIPRWILAPMGLLFGFKAMKIPGVEFAGVVEKTGSKVTRFSLGDRVFGTTTGMSYGGNAEYVCVPENGKLNAVAKLPENVPFIHAVVLPVGVMTAWFLLKKSHLKAGDELLVYGASGSVGSYAVQLGRLWGARVTAVCGTSNTEWVSALGADEVLDYAGEWAENPGTFDVILDAMGKISRKKVSTKLNPMARFVSVKSPTTESSQVLEEIALLASEKKLEGRIEKTITLEEVLEGHRFVDSGRKKGNIAVSINPQMV